MTDIASLGYEVDTSQVVKGDAALDKLTASTLQADRASKQLSANNKAAAVNTAAMARQAANLNFQSRGAAGGFRNLGLQLNQVAQVGGMTGNWMQAIAVQLPDILLGFGSFGIAAGIAAGAMIPFISTLADGSNETMGFDDAMDGLSQTANSVERNLDILRMSTEELVRTYGAGAETVRIFAERQARLNAAQAQRRLLDLVPTINEIAAQYGRASVVVDEFGESLDTSGNLRRLQEDLGVTTAQAVALYTAFSGIDEASNFEGTQAALENVFQTLEAAGVEATKLPLELQSALLEVTSLNIEAERLVVLMRDAAAEAANISTGVPLYDQNIGSLLPPQDREDPRRSRGGRRDPYEQNLNRLVQSLQTERETLENWYAESELLLQDHRARKLLGEQEHKEAMLALETEYASRHRQLADRTAQHEVNAKQAAVNAITGLLTALSTESKSAAIALIAINKGLSIAQAVQNTAVGITRAFAELGPIKGAIAAKTIAAMGKIQIAAIAATGLVQASNVGGGASTASASGGTLSATGPVEPEQSQTVTIDMNGAPKWLKEMYSDMFGYIQGEIKDGRRIVFT